MAQLYCDGRVLPERPITHVDWLVRAAPPTLVSRSYGVRHTGDGARSGLDVSPAAPLADRVLLYRDAVGNRRHPDGELHVLELPGALARSALVRRSLSSAIRSGKMDHRHSSRDN